MRIELQFWRFVVRLALLLLAAVAWADRSRPASVVPVATGEEVECAQEHLWEALDAYYVLGDPEYVPEPPA